MNSFALVFSISLFVATVTLSGQPAVSLVAPPSASSFYKIRAVAQPPAANQPYLAEIEVRFTPDLACMVQRWSNDRSEETWLTSDYQLTKPPGLPDLYVTASDQAPPLDLRKHYIGFSWLARQHLVGTERRGGKECFHYREEKTGRSAWVERETLLPVAYSDGGITYEYEWKQPQGDLKMPAPFLEELAKYRRADGR